MDKKIAGLLGAAAALTTMNGAQATPAQSSAPTAVTSYRDLLDPVPGALELLKADDARRAETAVSGKAQLAQYYHHHHSQYYHHHHSQYYHHHHSQYLPPIIRQFIPRPYYDHHHHHHHNSYYRGPYNRY
jgi:hypothetical protein